ncbi:MAG: hypothetical protein QM791_05770 [Ferruginibacter sp.]
MKYVFVIAFSICNTLSFAQFIDRAYQKELEKEFFAFIPNNFTVLDIATADFNNDGLKDIALVLTDTISDGYDKNRPLLLLQGTATGYTLSGKSDNGVLCNQCGGVFGDPMQE